MTGWLSIDPEIRAAYPYWELEDAETGMRARGDTYLQAQQQLREYVAEYDDYGDWVRSHGSMADKIGHVMDQAGSMMETLARGSY